MILPLGTLAGFWEAFDGLPADVQDDAREAYNDWRNDPRAAGVRFKHINGIYYAARIGRNYRAVCRIEGQEWHWFWIGNHANYDRLIARLRG